MTKSTRKTTGEGIEVNWSAVATLGIDLGDRFSRFVALDGQGERIGEGRVPTTAESFRKRFGQIGAKVIAVETGTHSSWVCRLLRGMGHQVTVANSRKLRLIYENRRKNDDVDAEYLARLVRVDPKLLSPVEHRDETAQGIVRLLRSRERLVKMRTGLITHVRGTVKAAGLRVPACSVEAFVKRARAMMPEELRPPLGAILEVIEQVNVQIAAFDRELERLARTDYKEAKLLMQIQGVGPLTSVAYMATVGDPGRFKKSRAAGAWVGLVPGQHESSDSSPQQRITKEGDTYLRSLLINCAHYILGPFGEDCDLRRHGLAIAARGGKNAKKRAVVAVARKLAVLLHRLWITGATYEPLRNARASDAA